MLVDCCFASCLSTDLSASAEGLQLVGSKRSKHRFPLFAGDRNSVGSTGSAGSIRSAGSGQSTDSANGQTASNNGENGKVRECAARQQNTGM